MNLARLYAGIIGLKSSAFGWYCVLGGNVI